MSEEEKPVKIQGIKFCVLGFESTEVHINANLSFHFYEQNIEVLVKTIDLTNLELDHYATRQHIVYLPQAFHVPL